MGMNPVWLLILTLVAVGLTALSRLELKAHTPSQTLAGFVVGFLMVFVPGVVVGMKF
jgi:membrane-associated phospholipid phosphatase